MVGLLGALLWGCPVQVPPHRPLPVEELARTSALAGVAVVERLVTFRDPENQAIYTDAHLFIEDLWKGGPASEIRLRQYGGRLGDRAAALPDWGYTLQKGERIAFFAVPFRGGSYTLKGSRQGLYRISGAPTPVAERDLYAGRSGFEEPVALEALKRRVLAALGGEAPTPSVPEVPPPAPSPIPGGSTPPVAPFGDEEPARGSSRAVREPYAFPRWILLVLAAAGLSAVVLTLRTSRPGGGA